MACQLTLLAPFLDVSLAKKYLFPSLKVEDADESVQDELGDWDKADWGWKVDEDEAPADSSQGNEASLGWLQECCVSISPTGELLALSKDDRLVLLEQRWDPKEQMDLLMKYSMVISVPLALEEGEKITSILCLPLASHKRSTQGGPDWTCVIVGFSSGYVRMYTESGKLLLSQIFSEEPVSGIKCRTYEPPRHSADAEKHEELTILYKRALVTIDGFSLFQSLRACRNQVARAAASGSELVQPPPLAYKKWALLDQDQITDHVTCGIVTPNPFDQMQTASMLSGPGASIKSTPPASHLYLTGGMGPYMGAFYAVEGSAQPMLSDVAHAVANKLKTALFSQISAASGWLGLGGRQNQENNKEKQRPKIEPATSLPARFGLPDKRRSAQNISLSPNNKLATTTDSFGRVILIDVERGMAVRMWKGYRDAQVGWMEVKEDTHPERGTQPQATLRHALFLLIYAPRRGILEVWTAQHGPRVAAFNVSKHCQLLCPSYGLMGLNIVTCQSVKVALHQCYLLDPEAGVKTLEIPFHLALSDKNSKRARDLHLLKKLKTHLKENTTDSNSVPSEMIAILRDMRIGNIKQQAIERILHTRYLKPGSLSHVLQAVVDQLQQLADESAEQEEGGQLDYESRMLLQFCLAEERLIQMYTELKKLNDLPCSESAADSTDVKTAVPKVLGVYGDELTGLRDQLNSYQDAIQSRPHVKFEENLESCVSEFLGCFECHLQREEVGGSRGEDGEMARTSLQILLRTSLSEARYNKLGDFLFKLRLERGACPEFETALRNSGVPPENLLHLLLHVWLFNDQRSLEETVHFASTIRAVSCLMDGSEVSVENNSLSPWWQHMRDSCAESENIGSALLAALVGRSVANEMMVAAKQERKKNSSGDSAKINLSDWESVTIDRTQWTVLVKQLEDLLTLQNLLRLKLTSQESMAIPTASEPITVSVKRVLDGGRRVLPELVAKWIAGQAIPPSMLCLSPDEQDQATEGDMQEVTHAKKQETQNPIVNQLQAVQRRLPHSLSTDILMANCSWEYGLQWNKDPETLFPLQQAVAYLKCIGNAVIQHGVASMMWRTFLQEKLAATAKLMQKVGKSPREYLCRRDVGLTNAALEKCLGLSVELLDTITQARHDVHQVPMFNVEDLWVCVQGPMSLVELAVEQKATNSQLVSHHFHLCAIMHAIMAFALKSVGPYTLFDTKGREAFFKPLDSSPVLSKMVEESTRTTRQQLLGRVMTQAVQNLLDHSRQPLSRSSSLASGGGSPSSDSLVITAVLKSPVYGHWSAMVVRLAKELSVDEDAIRRLHVAQLYSAGFDKLAEEVLLTVSDHLTMGMELLELAGQRLAQQVFINDTSGGVDVLTKCSPTLSSWLKSLDPNALRCPEVSLKDTAALVGHVVNQLPESHPEYHRAISMVELVQVLM